MVPLVEGILGLLVWLRRAVVAAVFAFVVVMVWLAVRRGGRRGLELAMLMLGAAVLSFSVAVFAARPPLGEGVAVALTLLSALLVVGAVVATVWYGLRRRKAPPAIEHTRPPWEDGGW
ncbi:MAG TPA: hypothetical protein VM221_05015 [Armatimonadota bacterium]|nr:hypothetical protein [Armatimonadota bacterium]